MKFIFHASEACCAMLKPSEQFHEYLFEIQRRLSAEYKTIFIDKGLRKPEDFGLVSFYLSKDGEIQNVRIVNGCSDEADKNIHLALDLLEKRKGIPKMPDFFDKPGIELSFMYGPIVRLKDRDPYTGSFADRYKYLDELAGKNSITTSEGVALDSRKTKSVTSMNVERAEKNVDRADGVDLASPPVINHEQELQFQLDFYHRLFSGINGVFVTFDRSASVDQETIKKIGGLLCDNGVQILEKGELTPNDRMLRVSIKDDGPKHCIVRLHFGDSKITSPQIITPSEVQKAFGNSVEWSRDFDHPPTSTKERQSFVLAGLEDFVEKMNITRTTGRCPLVVDRTK